jgi:DNA modification methylase
VSTRLLVGDCLAVLPTLEAGGIAACVTDPPYGLEFMGKDWDRFAPPKTSSGRGNHMADADPGPWGRRQRIKAPGDGGHRNEHCLICGKWRISSNRCQCTEPSWEYRPREGAAPSMLAFQAWSTEWAAEVFRVLTPGGYLLAFGGTRTYHRLTCAIEDAGFEVRDCLMWLHGQGFPKGKGCLKPGWEPIILARKPAPAPWLNIDGCRIDSPIGDGAARVSPGNGQAGARTYGDWAGRYDGATVPHPESARHHAAGRWPANVVLDEEAARLLDEQSGELTSGANPTRRSAAVFKNTYGTFVGQEQCTPIRGAESGGASRFYYCAKASTAERGVGNDHPTVKPLALMRWLVRLVTPAGGTVLDPFLGSGTTALACAREGFNCVGIDREPRYVEISRQRVVADSPMFANVELVS